MPEACVPVMHLSDFIGLGVIALLIIGVLVLLSQISKPYDVKTEEEFQKRRKESAGMMVAGLKGLQGILDPAEKKAAIVQQDLQRGLYNDQEEADDPPEAGAEADARARGKTPSVGGDSDQNRLR